MISFINLQINEKKLDLQRNDVMEMCRDSVEKIEKLMEES